MTGFIFYGRLKSTRLPRKGLLRIGDKSLLSIFAERISFSKTVGKVVFATSDLDEDAPLAELAASEGMEVFRGHPEDVLLRLANACEKYGFTCLLTTTLDSPLQLPEVIDATVDAITGKGFDMAYSFPGQPNGTDCYGLKVEALNRIAGLKRAVNTECWGGYFTGTGLFRWAEINMFSDYPHLKGQRVTIDYPEDFEYCSALYGELVSVYGPGFTLEQMARTMGSERFARMQSELQAAVSSKWEKHFSACAREVEEDIRRITAMRP